jgi:hypothetical protein
MAKLISKPRLLIDVEHWRERAEEARVTAETFSDTAAKQTMLDIAASYDRLAESAEQTLERLKRHVEN